jgi:hypothetical protein
LELSSLEFEESESEVEEFESLFCFELEDELESLSSTRAFGLAFALRFGALLADLLGPGKLGPETGAEGWAVSFACSSNISTSVFTFELGFSDSGMQAASITEGRGNDPSDTDKAMCSACVRHFLASLHHAFKQFITLRKFSGVSGLTLQDFRQPVF